MLRSYRRKEYSLKTSPCAIGNGRPFQKLRQTIRKTSSLINNDQDPNQRAKSFRKSTFWQRLSPFYSSVSGLGFGAYSPMWFHVIISSLSSITNFRCVTVVCMKSLQVEIVPARQRVCSLLITETCQFEQPGCHQQSSPLSSPSNVCIPGLGRPRHLPQALPRCPHCTSSMQFCSKWTP